MRTLGVPIHNRSICPWSVTTFYGGIGGSVNIVHKSRDTNSNPDQVWKIVVIFEDSSVNEPHAVDRNKFLQHILKDVAVRLKQLY